MQVLAPRRFTTWKPGGGVESISQDGWTLPAWMLVESTPLEVDSYFQDTDGRRFNTVCHCKPIGELGEEFHILPSTSGSSKLLPFVTFQGNVTGAARGFYREWWIVTPEGTILLACSPGFKWSQGGYRLTRLNIRLYTVKARMIGSQCYCAWAGCQASISYDKGQTKWTFNQVYPDSTVQWPYPPPASADFVGLNLSEISAKVQDFFYPDLRAWANVLLARMSHYSQSDYKTRRGSSTNVQILPIPDGREGFQFNEPLYLFDGYPEFLVRKNSYWKNSLVQHAYVDALQSAPRLNDNSISNFMEIFAFMRALVVEHRIEMPKSLSQAWLSYRYAYSTSKMDMEEAINFVRRNMSLDSPKGIKCFGSSSWEFQDGTKVICRCGLTLVNNELDIIAQAWKALYTYGLQPNFYVIWDMIPYSFVVDWFIPIGDMLSVLDTETNMMRGQYTITDVNFSLSYDKKIADVLFHYYSRWSQQPLEALNEFYWFDKPKTSDRVCSYRILDAISLLIGH